MALLVFGVIDLGVMIYGYLQTSAFGTLVGATAIIPYIIYFLITLAYAIKRRTLDSLPGAFSLGRWAWPVIGFVLVYTVVIMVVLSFPAPFHGSDKVLGYGLALAALWYFGGLLWRLRKGTAGVKPVDDLAGPPQAGCRHRTTERAGFLPGSREPHRAVIDLAVPQGHHVVGIAHAQPPRDPRRRPAGTDRWT